MYNFIIILVRSQKNSVDLLWHNRLGHVPVAKMRNISTLPTILSQKQPFMCSICLMAKGKKDHLSAKPIVEPSPYLNSFTLTYGVVIMFPNMAIKTTFLP